MSNDNLCGETIFSYSRAQAIEDGVLVDLSQNNAIRQHWKLSFACTAAVWGIIGAAQQKAGHDISGICHDISELARLALSSAGNTDRIYFSVVIDRKKQSLKLHIGPGDTTTPVLTLMLPTED